MSGTNGATAEKPKTRKTAETKPDDPTPPAPVTPQPPNGNAQGILFGSRLFATIYDALETRDPRTCRAALNAIDSITNNPIPGLS